VLAGAGFAAANVVSMLGLAVLGGYRRMVRVSMSQVVAAGAYALMVAWLLLRDWDSLEDVVIAAMLSTMVLALAARTKPSSHVPAANAEDGREASRAGLPAMAGELADLAITRLDLFVVALLLTPADVGRYAVAMSLAELLWIVPNGATQVLMPQVAKDTRGNATAPLVLVAALVTLLGALVLTLAGPTIVQGLFGSAFAPAVKALPWLTFGVVALGAAKILMADLAGRGNTAIRPRTAMVAAPLMIAADFALIPEWGIGGAGVASLLAYVVTLGLSVRAWSAASGQSVRGLTDVGSASRLVGRSLVSLVRPGRRDDGA
jgi:O-antigen/teichoic acid export membrane protein